MQTLSIDFGAFEEEALQALSQGGRPNEGGDGALAPLAEAFIAERDRRALDIGPPAQTTLTLDLGGQSVVDLIYSTGVIRGALSWLNWANWVRARNELGTLLEVLATEVSDRGAQLNAERSGAWN